MQSGINALALNVLLQHIPGPQALERSNALSKVQRWKLYVLPRKAKPILSTVQAHKCAYIDEMNKKIWQTHRSFSVTVTEITFEESCHGTQICISVKR